MDTVFFPSICLDYTGMWFSYGEIFLIGVLVGILLFTCLGFIRQWNFTKGMKK